MTAVLIGVLKGRRVRQMAYTKLKGEKHVPKKAEGRSNLKEERRV